MTNFKVWSSLCTLKTQPLVSIPTEPQSQFGHVTGIFSRRRRRRWVVGWRRSTSHQRTRSAGSGFSPRQLYGSPRSDYSIVHFLILKVHQCDQCFQLFNIKRVGAGCFKCGNSFLLGLLLF